MVRTIQYHGNELSSVPAPQRRPNNTPPGWSFRFSPHPPRLMTRVSDWCSSLFSFFSPKNHSTPSFFCSYDPAKLWMGKSIPGNLGNQKQLYNGLVPSTHGYYGNYCSARQLSRALRFISSIKRPSPNRQHAQPGPPRHHFPSGATPLQ